MGYQRFVLCLALLSLFGVNGSDEEAGFNIPGGKFRITDENEISDLTGKVTENLKKIGEKENGPSLEFVRVHSAFYQVVAGFKYELEAEIKENKTSVNCTISMWEKPWLDFVKFDVDCGEEESHQYQYLSSADPDEITTTGKPTDKSTSKPISEPTAEPSTEPASEPASEPTSEPTGKPNSDKP